MKSSATVVLCLVAICLYGLSLFLPAFSCVRTAGFPGYLVLAVGYMGLLVLDPRWFGNVGFLVLLFATLKSPTRTHPIIVGATALLAIASFAQAVGCPGGGGAPEGSVGLAIGGYLWVAALLIACIAYFSLQHQSITNAPETRNSSES